MPTQENHKSLLNPITTKRIQKARIGDGSCQANLTIYKADPSLFGKFFNYCIAFTWQGTENIHSCAIKQYLNIPYHEIFSDFKQFVSELEKQTLVIEEQKNNVHVLVKNKTN